MKFRTIVSCIFFIKAIASFWLIVYSNALEGILLSEEDNLTPYNVKHGSHLTYRKIRDCHSVEFGKLPHEQFPADTSQLYQYPIETKLFKKNFSRNGEPVYVQGHYSLVYNPAHTLSVLEPHLVGGCIHKERDTVANTGLQKNCLLAINAGFFNTKTGACLGNIVSDGRKVQDSGGIQNAHFGIRKNGTLFIGYIAEEELKDGPGEFSQLVGGVVWIMRNGESYLNFSKSMECESTEETGSMDRFVNILSARTIIGHDDKGRVVILQVDGKTGYRGVSLWEAVEFLKELKVVNAINLDGGGSATYVINGTLVNYPSDSCADNRFLCARKVSTIVCIHEPYCNPEDCSRHGECVKGQCVCTRNWLPPFCNKLSCHLHNCSQHGVCSENESGCICTSGWTGENCSQSCPKGTFGNNCSERCHCINEDSCDPVNGICHCKPGYRGTYCEKECPYSFYGLNCTEQCFCDDSCDCETVTGKCQRKWNSTPAQGHCITKSILREAKISEVKEIRLPTITVAIVGAVALLSLLINAILLWCSCACSCHTAPLCRRRKHKNQRKHLYSVAGDISSDDERVPMTTRTSRKN